MLQVVESPVMAVPVTGDVSSDTLSVGGNVTNPVFNRVATDNIRIARWTTTLDNRDNLAGTFSFRWQTVGASEHLGQARAGIGVGGAGFFDSRTASRGIVSVGAASRLRRWSTMTRNISQMSFVLSK